MRTDKYRTGNARVPTKAHAQRTITVLPADAFGRWCPSQVLSMHKNFPPDRTDIAWQGTHSPDKKRTTNEYERIAKFAVLSGKVWLTQKETLSRAPRAGEIRADVRRCSCIGHRPSGQSPCQPMNNNMLPWWPLSLRLAYNPCLNEALILSKISLRNQLPLNGQQIYHLWLKSCNFLHATEIAKRENVLNSIISINHLRHLTWKG